MFRLLALRTRVVMVVLGAVTLGFACGARYVPVELLPETYPVLAGAAVVAFLVALLVAQSVVTPVRELDDVLRGRLEGRADGVLRVRGHDEVTLLERSLNEYFMRVDDGLLTLERDRRRTDDERSRAEASAAAQRADVVLLLQLAERMHGRGDFTTTASAVLDAMNGHLRLGYSAVFLARSEGSSLELVSSAGLDPELTEALRLEGARSVDFRPGEGISGLAMAEGTTQVAPEGYRDRRFKIFDRQSTHHRRILNMCATPLLVDGKAAGLLMAFNAPAPGGFGETQQVLLEGVARLLAVSLAAGDDFEGPWLDGVSGLLRKDYFDVCMQREVARADRSGASLGLGTLDLVFAASVADARRRSELMAQVGREIRDNLRVADMAARDGYVVHVLMPHTDSLGAMFLAGRLKDRLDALAFTEGAGRPLFETTAAVAAFPDDVDEPAQLIEAVGAALEQAGTSGEARLVCYKRPLVAKEAS